MEIIVDGKAVNSVEDTAAALGKGVATIWRWIRDNKIETIKTVDRTYIPTSEIERLKGDGILPPD
jgi:hypothetical protein